MRVNHGPCRTCGKPILYLGCQYCSPSCNFVHLGMLRRQRQKLLRLLLERSRTAEEHVPRKKVAIYL